MINKLIISFLLLFLSISLFSDSYKVFYYDTESTEAPIRVVGDMDYAPIEWLEDGSAKGIIPGLLPVLAEYLNRDIEYRLMDWGLAQEKVLIGEADVLTVFSPNENRVKSYDFVDGILNFEMSLFVTSDNITIHSIADIRDKRVGVTRGGILKDHLKGISQVVIIEDHVDGFRKLKNGELDAVATTKWVGAYNIQQHKISGIKFIDPPILTKPTHLGIRKGDDKLKSELTMAIDKMQRDGSIDKLNKKWESLEIVYLTQGTIRNFIIVISIILTLILITFFIVYIIILKKQVKKRTIRLEKTQDRLIQTQKIASLSSVVTGIAHEINTPLGITITALSSLLDSNKLLKNRQIDIDSYMKRNLQTLEILNSNLGKISKKIETFKQIAGNHIVDEREEFLIENIIKMAINDSTIITSRIDIDFILTGDANLKITSYSSALKEVINHLIFNSYTHGFIGIKEPQVTIKYYKDDKGIVIKFSDNGIGIKDKDILKIFDPFYTTSLNRGTSGLGLNMIYTIITGLLGGEISVKSKDGLTFTINLPVESPEVKK